MKDLTWHFVSRHVTDVLTASEEEKSSIQDSRTATFDAQAELVLRNFLTIVNKAGAESKDVLKVTAYIVGANNWPLFNHAFVEAFGDHRPARSVVPVPELHHGYLIEIDGVALDAAAT